MSPLAYINDPVYKVLESLCIHAGISVQYDFVPDDSIDGAIWARADQDSRSIIMPDTDCFESPSQATMILGHEMGHILTGVDSTDNVVERVRNEAICDLSGWLLHALSEMIASKQIENAIWNTKAGE